MNREPAEAEWAQFEAEQEAELEALWTAHARAERWAGLMLAAVLAAFLAVIAVWWLS